MDWFRLAEGEYRAVSADARGMLGSEVFPGLCLDLPALLASDGGRVLAAQQAELHSPSHTEFIARLAARRVG